jgi:hypothetical protein
MVGAVVSGSASGVASSGSVGGVAMYLAMHGLGDEYE